MPVFHDSENRPPAVLFKPGDYKFTVTDFEIGMSNGGKTSGCPQYSMALSVDVDKGATVYETLTDDSDKGKNSKCAWRIDTWLKCCGVKLAKGQSFEFRQDEANTNGVPWVNPIGLRGWAAFHQESYIPKGSTEPRFSMKVRTFYTDKEKLPPDEKLRGAADAAAEVDEESRPF
jgi:hypothetical protein